MKHDRITEESQERAALCALGALSQHEARAFDQHLSEGCPVCERELGEFSRLVGALASDAIPVAPPAYLRDLLTARIEREQLKPQSGSSVIRFPDPETRQKQARSSRPSRGRWLPWAIAAALLIAFVYSLTMWRAERSALQAQLDKSNDAVRGNFELKAELERANARSTELAEITAVLSSAQWRIIPLAGQQPAAGSSGKIYWDIQAKRWVVTTDLPPAPAGKVYQLWFVTAEAKISAGLIRPDDAGHGFAIIQFPSNINQLAAAAITLEPEGGSDQPTMPIYLLGKTS